MRNILVACALLALLAPSAQAQESDAGFCRNGLFPRDQQHLGLAVVQGEKGEKIHFFDDGVSCPAKTAKCMRAPYLIPGDQVLVGKTNADWACVWYQGSKREFVSWVPRQNVAMRPAPALHPVRDWVGVWSNRSDTIRIFPSKAGGTLRMSSSLRWEGGVSSEGEKRANYGGVTAALHVQGPKATAANGNCQVVLTRVGKYLVADDNGKCGGISVRHTGVYLQRPH